MPDTGTETLTPEAEEAKAQEAKAAETKVAETKAAAKPPEAAPPKKAEGGEDYEKKFKGTQQALNRLLKHVGAKNLDAALSTDFSKPPKAGEEPKKAEVEPKTFLGDEPKMPDEADFKDDFEDLDKQGFRKAMEQYHRDMATYVYRSEQADALMDAEAEALNEEVAELPGYMLGEEADRDEAKDVFKVLVRGMAWHENGGRPATRAELRASRERLQSLFGGGVTARLAELDNEAETAKGKEPPSTTAAPPANGKEAGAETKIDWAGMTEPERLAQMVEWGKPSP